MLPMEEKYLHMVLKHPHLVKKFAIPEFQIAEMLSLKEHSLWYTQVSSWIQNPPNIADDKTRRIFQQEALIFKESIDNDYCIPDKYNEFAYLAIQDFLDMLKQMRQNTLMVISPWFFIVGELILLNSKTHKNKLLKRTSAGKNIQKCIAFDCDNEVDVNQKKSGACCVEHTRYYCKFCRCWHHYGTKIAEQHYSFKAFDWIKNKQERERMIQSLNTTQPTMETNENLEEILDDKFLNEEYGEHVIVAEKGQTKTYEIDTVEDLFRHID